MRSLLWKFRVPLSPFEWAVAAVLTAALCITLLWIGQSLSTQYTVVVPQRGGSYHEAVVGVPRFINPVLAVSDADRDLTQLVYSGLLRTLPSGAVATDLASGYTISDDGTVYTVDIRDDAYFSDGTKVTSADVSYTIDLAQDPATKSPKRANWEGVKVEMVDARTVKFTLNSPYAQFLENLSIGILPKHLWGSIKPEEIQFSTLNTKAVGSGPFIIDKVDTSASGVVTDITLNSSPRAIRRPYIDTLHLSFFTDEASIKSAMQSDGALGAHSVVPASPEDYTVKTAVLGRIFGVFYNQSRNEIFADKNLRRALELAIDKNALVSTLVGGYGTAIAGPLPPLVTENTASTLGTSSADRIAEATALIKSSGWVMGADGVFVKTVKKKEQRLSFTLATSNVPELKSAAEYVQSAWKSAGIEVNVQYFENSDLQQEVIKPRAYDALLFGEVIGAEQDLFAFWHSSQRNFPGLNIALYVNTSVDKLLEDARQTTNATDRGAKIAQAVELIVADAAATFLYTPYFVYATPPQLKGVELGVISIPADRFNQVEKWYVQTERVWQFLAPIQN